MNDSVISVRDFRKTYGDFVAVEGISFDVNRGEIFGLLGPNGAGKTTTLESLEGIRSPDSGTLRVAGVDPTRESHKLGGKIGVQLQALLRLSRSRPELQIAGSLGSGREEKSTISPALYRPKTTSGACPGARP